MIMNLADAKLVIKELEQKLEDLKAENRELNSEIDKAWQEVRAIQEQYESIKGE